MKVLLDTNFILTCAKQKLDFASLADELFDEKIKFIVPKEVLEELEQISERTGEKIKDKNSAELGLQLIRKIKPEIIKLNNKNVDEGIVVYIKKNKVVLATLDKKLKKKAKTKVLTIHGKRNLKIF